MQQNRADTPESGQPVPFARALTRREIITCGSLALGSLLLGGCAGGGGSDRDGATTRSSSDLPRTYWGTEGPQTVSAPPPQPVPQSNYIPPPVPAGVDLLAPIGVIPRSQWTRFSISNSVEHFSMNGVRRITVHHDGMPPVALSSMGQTASRIEQIRQSHVVGRGWADLGYHYVIDPSGRVWEGRKICYQGAHVKDQNENNLGILVMGNFDVQSPTSAALNSLDKFLIQQMQQYRIALGSVRTHRERAPTECPGTNLQAYMVQTRSRSGSLYAMAARVGLARG